MLPGEKGEQRFKIALKYRQGKFNLPCRVAKTVHTVKCERLEIDVFFLSVGLNIHRQPYTVTVGRAKPT